MFEKFTEKAKRTLFLARYEAAQRGAPAIETEHLLLGILKEGDDIVQGLLTVSRVPVSVSVLVGDLEREATKRERPSGTIEIPFSEDIKTALMYAEEESQRLMHTYIGPEHLLLGILRMEGSVAGKLLIQHGMRLLAARQHAITIGNKRILPRKKSRFLQEFCYDLVDMVDTSTFPADQHHEFERLARGLSRRTSKLLLVGETGIGKRALVWSLRNLSTTLRH